MSSELGIFTCSPRVSGNSDNIALYLKKLSRHKTTIYHLRDYYLSPCISCGYCNVNHGKCILDKHPDQSDTLFSLLSAFQTICIISPIYFYHLPAQFKIWIDRSQKWWYSPSKPIKNTKLALILLAGKKKGEKLFQGSLLTLKYFSVNIGLIPCQPCCLYGLDSPSDFQDSIDHHVKIQQYFQSFE